MPLGNIKVPSMKTATFKVANFRAPKVKISVKSPRTGITAKPLRPSQIKIVNKGIGQP